MLLIVPHPRLPTDFSRPIQVDLPISHAGAFVYWVEYDGDVPGERVKGREGYFNIDPILRTKSRTPILSDDLTPLPPSSGAVLQSEYVNLPLDGLSIFTVVSKWMGPVYEWRRHFKEAKDRGYTMLHYTPLQERGESNSPYSIRDQMKYDPEMLDGKREADGGKGAVEGILKIAREEYGLLSLTDVVLNHTANDSPWLVEHPEAGRPLDNPRRCWNLHITLTLGFSPANSPHLTPALELDSAIIEFSSSLSSKGLPTSIKSAQDVDTLIVALHEVIKGLNLWQYYVLDVTCEKESVRTALYSNNVVAWDGPDVASKSVVELAHILRASEKVHGLGKFASRFGVSVDGGVAAGLVKAAFVDMRDANMDSLADAWVRVVDVLNVPLYEEWEEDTRVALDNVKNRLKYTRLDEHGPRMGEISKLWVLF